MEQQYRCKCNDTTDMEPYANTILLGYYAGPMRGYRDRRAKTGLPSNGICVDRCLADEIIALWEAGIGTLGCCCGHNMAVPFINVFPEHFERVLALGYAQYVFKGDRNRRDTVIPKSIEAVDKH